MLKNLRINFLTLLLMCFSFAMNAEYNFDGGVISLMDGSTETKTCAGDGVADEIMVMLMDAEGPYSKFIATDLDGKILAIQDGNTFDFEAAGEGTCLLWHIGYKDIIGAFEVGMNKDELAGWLDFSNSITIIREAIGASAISTDGQTELEVCVDEVGDPFTVQVSAGVGKYSQFIITDEDLNILAKTVGNTFDLNGAGVGTCLIWHVNFNNIFGNVVGLNAADMGGCYMLSNPITVVRNTATSAELALTDGSIEMEICAGDGVSDAFTPSVSGGTGNNSAWVITDSDLNILGLPEGPTFDLEGAGEGTCLLWYVSYNGNLGGAAIGANAANLSGCFALSNSITIVREGVSGGAIELAAGGTDLSMCAGDGKLDLFTVSSVGVIGDNQLWIITDEDLNILGLPNGPTFNLEDAGAGTCLLWNLSYNGNITGAETGLNAGDLEGCFSLSNAITVVRSGVSAAAIATEAGETSLAICAGDGIADPFTVSVEGGVGESSTWVITDSDLNILGLPEGPTFDLEGAGAGTCLVWYLNYNGELTGIAVGANAGDLVGCHVLSNPITVSRNGVTGGELTLAEGGTELAICAGDGVSDAFTPVLEGATGENSAWVITDPDLKILGLPEGPTFDLEGAGAGTCLVWHVSYNGELTGATLEANAADLGGCFALSNAVTITRSGVGAAAISIEGGGTELTICAGDGVSDAFTALVDGGVGESSAWVITDPDLNILGLPAGPTFDLEGAGAGMCLVWYLSYNGELTGAAVGANAADLGGCHVLSNPITVTREGIGAAAISIEGGGTEIEICAGDGVSDAFTAIVDGGEGENSSWVITDTDLNILGLPEGPIFDLEGAGAGTCLVWHVSHNGELTGAAVGENAANLGGCFAFSNAVTVTRKGVAAATISLDGGGTELETCAGDGVSDAFTAVVEGGEGESSAWVITDTALNILGLPEGPTFDLEGAGEGVCLVWYLSYNGDLTGAVVGANAADLGGCYILSNSITVVRKGVSASAISLEGGGTELSICAGDGISDAFTPVVEGGLGESSAWVITDTDLNILGLPEGSTFDLEGAGAGTCLVWNVNFNLLSGAEVGMNTADLSGCFALSNSIIITRSGVSAAAISIDGGGTEISICAGDGVSDMFTAIVEGGESERMAWVITDTDLNILGLPAGPTFDLDGAGPGTCLVWHLNYNGELTGAEIGANAADLGGCFILSNSITVERSGVGAAEIALEGGGTNLAICAGDGISDAFTPTVSSATGMNSAWVITDTDLNILGLPEGPTFDLEGAGAGTCLIWFLSFNGEITGAEVGANAANLAGCYALSNAITVERTGVVAAMISIEGGGTSLEICAGDGVSDAFTVLLEGGDGEVSGWVITDTSGNVLGLPEGPTFDLEDAGAGVCVVWYYNATGEVSGLDMGANVDDLVGCVAFSNAITVTRAGVEGATLTVGEGMTEMDICVGDGNADLIMPIVDGGVGEKTAWVITDSDTTIVGLPFAPPFNLEAAGAGTCLIWQISYNGSIFNVEAGQKAYDIEGCIAFSNAITVRRTAVEGGVLSMEDGGTEVTICAGDSISDAFNVTLEGIAGDNSAWVITDEDLNILGLPTEPPFDLEGAGEGVCLIWHLSFNGEITGAVVDSNAMNLAGCFELSNPITVTRVTTGELCGGGLLKPEDVDIYPNPSESFINVNMPKLVDDQYSITVYDAFGRRVLTKTNMSGEYLNIDTENYASGVYYLNIIHNNESMVKEFVKL